MIIRSKVKPNRRGRVLSHRLLNGVVVCDVVDSYGGVYLSVPIVGEGGGGSSTLSHFPLTNFGSEDTGASDTSSSDVVLSFGQGLDRPVIVGTIQNSQSEGFSDTEPNTTDDAELATSFSYESGVKKINDVAVCWGSTGFFGIDTSIQNKPIKMQVGKDSFVRISHGSTYSVDERVLLGDKTADKLDEIITRINDLGAKLDEVRGWIAAGVAAEAATPLTGFTAMGTAGGTAGAIPSFLDDVTMTKDELLAAALRISKKSKSEEI